MLRSYNARLTEGQSLSEQESEAALEWILSEQTSDEEICEFLTHLAEKGETVEEITGFARVMRRLAVPVRSRHSSFVDTAGTGGGKTTFNVSTAAAFVIAGAGIPVAKHGNRAITSKSGSADVLTELGIKVDASARVAGAALDELDICFMFAPHFHPAMKRVAAVRRSLGRRTIFNMVGPLTNPAGAPCQIVGVYAEELTLKLAQALLRLGCRRAWVVHSSDGLDEISNSAPTRVAEVSGSAVREFDFVPEAMQDVVPTGGSPVENARIIREILEGSKRGPEREIVVLNASAAIHVTSGESFKTAIEQAGKSIDSGAARGKLNSLAQAYNMT